MPKHNLTNALSQILKYMCVRCMVPVVLTVAVPSLALAQTTNDVTLRFANGEDSISGTLTDMRDGIFFVDSSIGPLEVPADGVVCIGDACPDETRLEIDNAQVVLTSKDGSLSISGDLIEIQNDEYVLATAVGEQRIAANLVDCEGVGCLPPTAAPTIGGPVELVNGGIIMRGTLLAFENGSYIFDDDVLGEVRVNSNQFSCRGEGCP